MICFGDFAEGAVGVCNHFRVSSKVHELENVAENLRVEFLEIKNARRVLALKVPVLQARSKYTL